ncbi:MAG: phosphodiester glycosidase family protein [Clostridiales bacterium]|jgi:hypothetical protein|nr:phosphodiester glycosidase family protein [Clostridiales bacterium]MDU6974562.1 phosphodiester glycosidase family protein [Clostridiales bacterium]
MKRFKKVFPFIFTAVCMSQLVYGASLESVSVNQTTLIPLRLVSEELKANVSFDKASQKIAITLGDKVVELKPNCREVSINGEKVSLDAAPEMIEGTTYVPLRFIGEALGANVGYNEGVVSISLGDLEKQWTLVKKPTSQKSNSSGQAFKYESKTIKDKTVKYVTIDMNNASIVPRIQTAGGKINQVDDLKNLGKAGKVAINGTYFAAYNGDTPYPDGTLVKDGKPLHITDIGCTIGFTSDNEVLIDFVKTRVQGYVNDEPRWLTYRVNRPTGDASATVIYTPEYGNAIKLEPGYVGVVCSNNKIAKKVTQSVQAPQDGFVLVMGEDRANSFNIGDAIRYEVTFETRHTSEDEWNKVQNALSAGPSLLINGKATPEPKEEGFTEAKILTQVASRSFIGTTADGKVIVGTTSANISELKEIAKALGLQNAMCLDGGASSGLYYNGTYQTSPGRKVNNSIVFTQK